ncbi:hypothetical protein D3H55_01400 [Bacillus salacetis]|uniref:Uncharacterized protein n=1 Tax=Bacillus salacetis TaxID=2315464 RepID=A0A3A1R7S3_9BACI|nr:hypothetical protein [Bacillus salacetis]RIW39037.1 hypothetical protein D3H55_01400 [Bacillus salacetis]
MLWKLFFGKSQEEYLQEVMDRLSGVDELHSGLAAGLDDVKVLLEDSRKNGGLQEEKLDRILTIMEEWTNTYEDKMDQVKEEKEQQLKSLLEGERQRIVLEEQKEKEYLQQIEELQHQAEEYKQKHEESETNLWSLQKEIQSLKKKMNSMQNDQLAYRAKQRSAPSGRQAGVSNPQMSKEEQSLLKDQYDYFPVSKSSKTTVFNPMRYSK